LQPSGVPCGDSECPSFVVRGREQVGDRQTAVGPPFLGDRQNLFLRRQVIEAVSSSDSLAESKVTGQDYVFAAERDDEGTLCRPRAYPGDLGQFRN